MKICLTEAEACLRSESPQEYIKQLGAAAEGLRRARLLERKYGGAQAGTELDELRRMLEPKES